jgi:hypothetical protein
MARLRLEQCSLTLGPTQAHVPCCWCWLLTGRRSRIPGATPAYRTKTVMARTQSAGSLMYAAPLLASGWPVQGILVEGRRVW